MGIVSKGNSKLIKRVTIEDVKSNFNDKSTLGILVMTNKDTSGLEWHHCYKVAKIIDDTFFLMNPSTNNSDQG